MGGLEGTEEELDTEVLKVGWWEGTVLIRGGRKIGALHWRVGLGLED